MLSFFSKLFDLCLKHEFCLLSLYIIRDKWSLNVCFNLTTKDTLTLKAAQTPESCHLPFFLFPLSKVFLSKDTFQLLAIGTPYTSKLCLGVILNSKTTQRKVWRRRGDTCLRYKSWACPVQPQGATHTLGDSDSLLCTHLQMNAKAHPEYKFWGYTEMLASKWLCNHQVLA